MSWNWRFGLIFCSVSCFCIFPDSELPPHQWISLERTLKSCQMASVHQANPVAQEECVYVFFMSFFAHSLPAHTPPESSYILWFSMWTTVKPTAIPRKVLPTTLSPLEFSKVRKRNIQNKGQRTPTQSLMK